MTRLAIYLDAQYRERDGRVLTNFESLPFLTFGLEAAGRFDEVVLIGRAAPEGVGVDHALPAGPTLAPLPYYPSLVEFGPFTRAVADTIGRLWQAAGQADVVWAFGPHPFSFLLALFVRLRGRRVVLGVRQDTMRYFRSRLRGRAGRPLLGPLWLLDAAWRLLGRTVPVTVVGEELERRYGGPRPGVEAMTVSLVRSDAVEDAPRSEPLGEPVRLLTVGRIEPEKHPMLLVEALAELGPGFVLTWVGTGRMTDDVRRRADELGIGDRLTLAGFVPPGEALFAHYREADLFVHVALTEGVPQVLLEALSAALPIVATAVGGVPRALEHGAAGLLVPPDDRPELVAAVRAAVADRAGRDARVTRGLELARAKALDVEAARVGDWLRGS